MRGDQATRAVFDSCVAIRSVSGIELVRITNYAALLDEVVLFCSAIPHSISARPHRRYGPAVIEVRTTASLIGVARTNEIQVVVTRHTHYALYTNLPYPIGACVSIVTE